MQLIQIGGCMIVVRILQVNKTTQGTLLDFPYSRDLQWHFSLPDLGKPSREKSAVFLNIVQKAFDPPPLSFEHHAEFAVSAGSENLI